MSASSERARQRALQWTGEIVLAGTPKDPSYEGLSVDERLRRFLELNRRVWESVYGPIPTRASRAEWPGEILDLESE